MIRDLSSGRPLVNQVKGPMSVDRFRTMSRGLDGELIRTGRATVHPNGIGGANLEVISQLEEDALRDVLLAASYTAHGCRLDGLFVVGLDTRTQDENDASPKLKDE